MAAAVHAARLGVARAAREMPHICLSMAVRVNNLLPSREGIGILAVAARGRVIIEGDVRVGVKSTRQRNAARGACGGVSRRA